MSTTELAGGTVGEVNFGLAAAVGFLNPLGAQLDAFLAATLGPLTADLQAQYSATLQAQASIALSIGDPFAALTLALAAVGQLQAAIQAALAFPPITIAASGQLSATAALAGALQLKLGLLDAAISAMIAIKIPALQAAANLGAQLSAGPIVLMEVDALTLAAAGAEIQTAFSTGVGGSVLPPGDEILPGDGPVTAFILVTKNPVAAAALSAVLV
jgi:hypothetical protein